jgi:GAF domain-containing protein
VVEITLDWAIRQSGASAGMIGIVDEEQDVLHVVGSNGYDEGSIFYETFGTPLSMNKGIWRRVIQSGTAVFSRNLATDPDYIESLPNAAAQVVVPIISASDVIGVVLVESEQEEDLTLLDMQFLSRLADHASPALTNAQLFEQLNEQQEQRAEFVSFIAHE